jgi:hypothetical protein
VDRMNFPGLDDLRTICQDKIKNNERMVSLRVELKNRNQDWPVDKVPLKRGYTKEEILSAIIVNLLLGLDNEKSFVATASLDFILFFLEKSDILNLDHQMQLEWLVHMFRQLSPAEPDMAGQHVEAASRFLLRYRSCPVPEDVDLDRVKSIFSNLNVQNAIKNVTGFDFSKDEKNLRDTMTCIHFFKGPQDIAGFSSFRGININVDALASQLSSIDNLDASTQLALKLVFCRVVSIHEEVHVIPRFLNNNFNFRTPIRLSDNVKEAGTKVEIDLLGEEADILGAFADGKLDIAWIHGFNDACESVIAPIPKLPPEVISLYGSRSVSMAFKRRSHYKYSYKE